MPQVESTTHLGMSSNTVKFTTEELEVTVNIQKVGCSMYSLMTAGLHGENGLDPQTMVQLYFPSVIVQQMKLAKKKRHWLSHI